MHASRDAEIDEDDHFSGGDAFAANVSLEMEAEESTHTDIPARPSPSRMAKKDEAELRIVHQVRLRCVCDCVVCVLYYRHTWIHIDWEETKIDHTQPDVLRLGRASSTRARALMM